MTTSDTQANLADDIRLLLDKGELTESLHAAVRKQVELSHWDKAQRTQKTLKNNVPVTEVEDDTLDFIVYQLRARNARFIKTQLTLRQEVRKYITKTRAPEHHELWELLSEAIRTGAKEGWARRLDAAPEVRNDKDALWTGINCKNDRHRLDIAAYELACKDVPVIQRRRECGRILTPADAVNLARELLTVAVAPVPFSILIAEAKRHVVWSFHSSMSFDTDEKTTETILALADRTNDKMDWVREEAENRADRIWHQMEECSGQKLLCLYVLPKHFFGRKVKLETFGQTQRIGEQSKHILGVMGEHLHVEKIAEECGEHSVFEDSLRHLCSLVASHLVEKCSENGLDGGFTVEEETSQGEDS